MVVRAFDHEGAERNIGARIRKFKTFEGPPMRPPRRPNVDIKVGNTSPIGDPRQLQRGDNELVEGRLLAVRAPRRSMGGSLPQGAERRASDEQRDPPAGRVLVLLIPDGGRLPDGIESGQYRVFLRFARR
jgi:hypothetical protein